MDHVSRPMLIALAATVALLAVWLVALRPKPVAVGDSPLAPTKAIPAAEHAGAVSDGANATLQAAANAADTRPGAAAASSKPATANAATHPATKPAAVPAVRRGESRGERNVLREIREGKVVVMLFWSADSADDLATRGTIRSMNRHGGKVKVHVIPIGRAGDYSTITRSVTIARSPTTLIIGRDRRVRTIAGLTERKPLRSAVAGALATR